MHLPAKAVNADIPSHRNTASDWIERGGSLYASGSTGKAV